MQIHVVKMFICHKILLTGIHPTPHWIGYRPKHVWSLEFDAILVMKWSQIHRNNQNMIYLTHARGKRLGKPTACTTWPNFKVMPSRTKNGHLRGNFLNGLKFGILLTDHQCLSMRSVVKRARKLESTHIIRHVPDHFSGPQDSGWNWNRNVYFLMSQPLPCIK